MARGFGTVLGNGNNDIITTTFTTSVTVRSYFIWYLANGAGGGDLARLWDNTFDLLIYENGTNDLQFNRNFSTQTGAWTCVAPAASGTLFHSFGMSYDAGNVANNPVMYVDGASVSVTRTQAPIGTVNNTAHAYTIGNVASLVRCFNGALAEFTMWNALLTPGEFAALGQGIRPYNIRPGLTTLPGYWPIDGLQSPEPDLSGAANNGTVSGTLFHTGPPETLFSPFKPQNFPAGVTAVTGPCLLPLMGVGTC